MSHYDPNGALMSKVKNLIMNTSTCNSRILYMLRIHYLGVMTTYYFMSTFMFIHFYHYAY